MKKKMKTKPRIFGLFLFLLGCLLATGHALAGNPTTLTVGGTDVLNGGYWTTNADGTLTPDGASADNYNVYYDGNGTLTLKDATINGTDIIGHVGAGIYAEGDLTIVLEGTSTVTGVQDPNGESQSIRVSGNLTIQGDGSLTAQGAGTSSGSSYGVFVIGSFTQQSGSVTAIGGDVSGNYTSTGLYVYGGTVTAQDGTLTATGGDTSGSSYGISMSSSSSVTVGSATVTVTGGTGNYSYGLYVNPSSPSVSPSVTLSGSGSLTARSGSGTDTAVGIYLFRDSSFNENPLAPTGDGSWLIYGQSGQTSAVGGNYTLEENLTIESGNTLTIPAGSTLTVPQGKTLTVNGTLTNQGTLSIAAARRRSSWPAPRCSATPSPPMAGRLPLRKAHARRTAVPTPPPPPRRAASSSKQPSPHNTTSMPRANALAAHRCPRRMRRAAISWPMRSNCAGSPPWSTAR